ncbi:MAG: VPGUxxT family thioredoxin-like (seleno)protein, type 2, partial [Bacteroidota bacterium]
KKEDKPLLILFQEVPGCMNCQRFGKQVMSNPLIVDVIENEFVPLCVFNNKKGKDAEVLAYFNEPSWNNPVVRIFDAEGEELTPRMAKFHPKEIVQGIGEALQSQQKDIPAYFKLLASHTQAQYGQVEEAVFPMYCFWSGELKLGQLEGVVNTVPGFMNGREVVKVTYDGQATTYEKILQAAKERNAVDGAFVEGEKQRASAEEILGRGATRGLGQFSLDGEPKYYMSHTAYKYIPMLPTQRIEVNRALYQRRDPQRYLSPSQIALLDQIQQKKGKWKDYSLSEDLVNDWEEAQVKITK